MNELIDQADPISNPALRTCGTCGCCIELTDPNNVANKQLACRWAPVIAHDRRVRVPDPSNPKRSVEAIQRSFMHQPITAEGMCMGGWCPKGTPPGENWQLTAFLKMMSAG